MINEAQTAFRLNVAYINRLVADVPQEQMTAQTAGVVNHPAWTLGHLSYSFQALGDELGLTPWLPSDWANRYSTGSSPVSERSAYSAKPELLDVFNGGRERIDNALEQMSETDWQKPLPDARYRAMFPTVGHAVVYVLVGHMAVHAGQLGVWRRVTGLPPVPELNMPDSGDD